MYKLHGAVEIYYGSYVLKADEATYNSDTKEATATGHFALDLFQHTGMPRSAMTYFISAFGGATVNGPFQVAVVTEKMLKDAGAGTT